MGGFSYTFIYDNTHQRFYQCFDTSSAILTVDRRRIFWERNRLCSLNAFPSPPAASTKIVKHWYIVLEHHHINSLTSFPPPSIIGQRERGPELLVATLLTVVDDGLDVSGPLTRAFPKMTHVNC